MIQSSPVFKRHSKPDASIRRLGLALCIAIAIAASFLYSGRKSVHAQAAPQQAASQPPQQPQLAPQDAAGREKAILAHLNAVLRFYRDSSAPIQKVGEPSDLVYRDQAVTLATQIGGFAFQSARAEASLIDQALPKQQTPAGSQAQHLQQVHDHILQQIADLKSQDDSLSQQLNTARAKQVPGIKQQRQQIAGQLELQTAMADAIGKILSMAGSSNDTGFAAQIDQLERSAPGLTSGKSTTVAPDLESLSAAQSAGVTSQAKVLFQLLSTREDIDSLLKEATALHQQALDVRTPLTALLRQTISQGQALSQSDNSSSQPAATATSSDTYAQLTKTFKAISSASVPLSQEVLTIEQAQASLQAWRAAVNEEYLSILRSLLLRVVAIAIALAVIFFLGKAWDRGTRRYVRDVRRRRQLLLIRRLVIGFLSGLVLIFGLVTQFSSLATFAGFITAGIAVGLQTILLSVAAYFFIIGRYGVKVGDRITIASVTGDVVEVGLVRFYMMEMAGTGTDLYPTGRVAVFSNAVLFQAAMPLYKQMPGTEYAWHELTVKLKPDADYKPAVEAILSTMQKVYKDYSQQIELQHRSLESWMDSSLDMPGVQSNLQLVDGGLQFWARFPVIIRQAAGIDEKMIESLLQLIATNQQVKDAVATPPAIKAAVKG